MKEKYWVIVPAAGVGRRMGQAIPKQYLKIADKTIIEYSLDKLLSFPEFSQVTVMVSEADTWWPSLGLASVKSVTSAWGGAERSDSVLRGLQSLESMAHRDDWVLVHDAVRPCVRCEDIKLLLKQLKDHAVGGILASQVNDTLKFSSAAATIQHTVERENIWAALTPQLFRYGLLLEALQKAQGENIAITDEASAIELLGLRAQLVEGHRDNIKITRAEDLLLAETYLKQQQVIACK